MEDKTKSTENTENGLQHQENVVDKAKSKENVDESKKSNENGNKKKKPLELAERIKNANWITLYLLTITLLILSGIIWVWPENTDFFDDEIKKDSSIVYLALDSSLSINGKIYPSVSALLRDTSKQDLKITMNDSVIVSASKPLTPKSGKLNSKKLLILILLIGALGSNLHGLISLSGYIGNKTYEGSWFLWYILRPFAGAILSFLFYLTIMAGFFNQITTQGEFFTIVALSGLVGLFSKQALNKLSDLFDFIFTSNKDKELKDKMTANPTPEIKTIVPDKIDKGSDDAEIIINGRGFLEKSVIRIKKDDKSEEYKPTLVKSDELKFMLPAKYRKVIGTVQISIFNPAPEGGLSNMIEFKIE
jgi:hypothetical protein